MVSIFRPAAVSLFRRLFQLPLVLISGLGLLMALAALVPIPENLTCSPVVQRCFDALHLPMFALAAAVVLWFVLHQQSGNGVEKKNSWRDVLPVALLFVGIAALVEVIQPSTGRSASMRDFLYGAAGSVLGAWWISRSELWAGRERAIFCVVALMSLLAVVWPIVSAGQHSRQLTDSFPKLLVEVPGVNGAFWKAEGGAEIRLLYLSKEGRNLAAIHVATPVSRWCGVNFRPNAGAADWSGHGELVLQIFTQSEAPFELGLKIEDYESIDHSTRFNHSISLTRGRQEVRIPLGEIAPEQVDLTHVKRLALFVSDQEPARSFVIEQAFLE